MAGETFCLKHQNISASHSLLDSSVSSSAVQHWSIVGFFVFSASKFIYSLLQRQSFFVLHIHYIYHTYALWAGPHSLYSPITVIYLCICISWLFSPKQEQGSWFKDEARLCRRGRYGRHDRHSKARPIPPTPRNTHHLHLGRLDYGQGWCC